MDRKIASREELFRNKNLIENLQESVENLFSKLLLLESNTLFCQKYYTPEYMLDLTFQMNSSSANMLKVRICLMVQVLHKGKKDKSELSVQFQW